MVIKALNKAGKITKSGTYNDIVYFDMSEDERKLVDDIAAEIYLSTRFMSLSSNKLHGASKQELKNDLVKGGYTYPRTISRTINFIQYHSLSNRNTTVIDRDKSHRDGICTGRRGRRA